MFRMIETEMQIHQMEAERARAERRYQPPSLDADIPRDGAGRRWEVFRRIVDGR